MNFYHTLTPILLTISAAKIPSCSGTTPIDAHQVLAQSSAVMGAGDLRSLKYTADGSAYTFGQAYTPASAWPKVNVHGLTRTFNYETASLREEVEISRAEPLGGGAYPQSAKQRNDQFVSGNHSWNMNGSTVVPFSFFRSARVNQLWVSPHGVLQAAERNQPLGALEFEGGEATKTVSFTELGALSAKIYFDDAYLVERVESRIPDNLLGETSVVTEYSDYRDFNGVAFPTRVVQSQDGHPLSDLTVRDVQPNATAEIAVPAAVSGYVEQVISTQIAAGIWFLTGSSHNSIVIEMSDHVILVEAPLTDERTVPVIAEARRLVPGKPLRYVLNSHNHFDHAGGLRAAVAAGAIVVTQAQNKAYFERAFATPNTLRPDELAKSRRRAVVKGVEEKLVLSDGTRQVELHHVLGSNHCDSMLMIYLPIEKLLIEADLFTPGSNPNAPTPAVLDPQKVLLVENIERLQLSIERILPLHGRVATMTELLTAVGKQATP